MTGTTDGTAQLAERQTEMTGTTDGTAQLAERQTEMTGTLRNDRHNRWDSSAGRVSD